MRSDASLTVSASQPAANAAIDPMEFRAAIGAFATGVAIITTREGGRCHGMAVNSLTSVSLDPCSLLFCVKNGSTTGNAIRARGAFAVNLLADDQHHLVKQFCANPDDRFAGVPMEMSPCGLPILSGSLAHLCCTITDTHASGDHAIIVGRVHALETNAGDPLVFFRGAYGGYQSMLRTETPRRAAAG